MKIVCFVFLYARRKENRKKEKIPHNVDVLNTDVPQLGSCKHTYTYINLVVGTRTQFIDALRQKLQCGGSFKLFIFFTKRFARTKSTKKYQKHKDTTKQKHKNANKRISDFFPLRCFFMRIKRSLFYFGSLMCVFVLN